MNKNIVRIQIEVVKRDALVRGGMIQVYTRPPSHFVWYPKMPDYSMIDDPGAPRDKILCFREGGMFMSFAALGSEVDGTFNGDIDYLLSVMPAGELFKEDLAHFAIRAQHSLNLFDERPMWAELALYHVEVDQKKAKFVAFMSMEDPVPLPIKKEAA